MSAVRTACLAARLFLVPVLAPVFALAACGGADKSAAGAQEAKQAAPAAAGHEGHAAHGRHAHRFPATVAAFHDVLAPLWHAEPGPARVADTCVATTELETKAMAIQSAPVPLRLAAGQEQAWREAAQALLGNIDALETECAIEGHPAFDARLSALHDAFHALIALIGHP